MNNSENVFSFSEETKLLHKIPKFYETNMDDFFNYDVCGKYKINKLCFQSYPCKHIVFNTSTCKEKVCESTEICKLLKEEGIEHPHFSETTIKREINCLTDNVVETIKREIDVIPTENITTVTTNILPPNPPKQIQNKKFEITDNEINMLDSFKPKKSSLVYFFLFTTISAVAVYSVYNMN